jgi:succinyl-diaminopimelate desuccinylase
MDAAGLKQAVLKDRERMVESLCSMVRIKAIGPESHGEGEAERGKYLAALSKQLGFNSVEVFESVDPRVPAGKRPNIVIRVKGTSNRNLWVVTHMDTVPEGDVGAWHHPPFEPKVTKDRISGRGTEDNGQELIASLFGLSALLRTGVTPECNIGLVFVSDEEHGNTHGIDFIIEKGIFKTGDMAVVPDHGLPGGTGIAVVEKSIAWIEVEVVGRQTHASTPDKGVNAFEAAARFAVAGVESLRKKFPEEDSLFDNPRCTFEPTKCDSNGPNVNTVPGRQTFSFDFRVLPNYKLDDIMSELRKVADSVEKSTGSKINMSWLQRADAAPGTDPKSEIVLRLASAVESVRGTSPHPFGIGGGTCAAPFRRIGIESAVWSSSTETAHDANEYILIDDMVSDAQVYALLFAGKNIGES